MTVTKTICCFFNDTATTESYTLSLHDALPIVGSLAGGILGVAVGLPIPVVGSVIAALLFAALGALLGGIVGERWHGQNWTDSLKVGHAAFWGRLTGTLGKVLVGFVMVNLVMGSLCLMHI